MTLSELKNHLQSDSNITFTLPNGKTVPAHFHITEVGKITKDFIDCGGTLRSESKVNLQLWASIDFHHRLKADKFLHILELAEKNLDLTDNDIEVEYQDETIGKYGLEKNGNSFLLTNKSTDCLAKENCGLPKINLNLSTLKNKAASCCTPGSGCC